MKIRIARRIPHAWRKAYTRRTPAKMAKDLIVAFDQLHELKTKVWILTGALVGACGVISWLATQLFSRLH